MKKRRFVTVILLVLAAAFCFTGCMGKVITEDPLYQELPDVDPDDGVEKEVNVTLYYRLTNEAYLVGINRSVTVLAGERTESAVIRTLIEGVPMLVSDISALFPRDTRIEDVTFENGILYVTLSPEFLDEAIVNSIDRDVYLSEESYYEALYLATQEMYLVRRLAVMSIVNTIAGSGRDVKVQLMIQGEDGEPRRFTEAELGISKEENLVDSLGFDKEIIITSEKVAQCFLDHIVNREYEKAYVLLAESDYKGAARPAYADFEAKVVNAGRMESYDITGMHSDDAGEYALVDIDYQAKDGMIKHVNNARLYLEEDGEVYKVSYSSFDAIMEN